MRGVLRCLKKLWREQYFNSKSFLDNLNCTPHNDYIYIPYKIITMFLISQFFFPYCNLKTTLQLRKPKTHQLSVTFTRKSCLQFYLKKKKPTILSFNRLAVLSSLHQCPSFFPVPVTHFSHTQSLALIGKRLKCIPHRNRINKRQVHKRKPLGPWIKIFSHESKKDNRHLLVCLLSSLKALKLIHGFITTIK